MRSSCLHLVSQSTAVSGTYKFCVFSCFVFLMLFTSAALYNVLASMKTAAVERLLRDLEYYFSARLAAVLPCFFFTIFIQLPSRMF
jgi:hypothetical protein